MEKIEDNKLAAIMLWVIWPVGLVLWLSNDKNKKDEFLRFQVKQWLVFVVASSAIIIGTTVLSVLTMGFFMILGVFLYILIFIWWLLGLIYAAQGEKKELFWIGKYAEKFNI